MGSPTNVNLNDLIPPPKPDAYNVEFQAGVPYPDPNEPGKFVRDTSSCYRFPQVGGAIVLTADYQLGASDCGRIFIANSSSAITLTLPPLAPVLFLPQGIWRIKLKNFGT